jgi:hypothetical protein
LEAEVVARERRRGERCGHKERSICLLGSGGRRRGFN